MGTHPIFESDFDCLTEMGDAEPVVDPPPVQREEETKLNFLTVGYLGFRDFMAANGWYCLFGLILIAFIIKNLESRYQKIVDRWEVAKAKKNPDQFVDFESARLARLEKLQSQHDQQAKLKKLRNEEIEKEKRERIEAARENGGGKATMAKWEENKKDKIIKKNETNPTKTIKKESKPRLRGEYSPLTGSGGGNCKFVPGRKGPAKGG